MVGVVSYKIFAMVHVVACKKEDGRETIVDQRDVDIGKTADAVVQTEYVCEELSTKIRSVVCMLVAGIHTAQGMHRSKTSVSRVLVLILENKCFPIRQ